MPRFLFTNLPLGNPIGPADDPTQQLDVLRLGCTVLETAAIPQTTVKAPVTWAGRPDWQDSFMPVDDAEALRKAGELRRAEQAEKKTSAQDDSRL